jgi:hypothetical protein
MSVLPCLKTILLILIECATWQYSISGDNGFVDGTNNSFTLADNATYAVNAIQVRQTVCKLVFQCQ